MNLLETFIKILSLWRPAFSKKQCFQRAFQHALISLCMCGRKTITQIIGLLGRDQQDWSADYKLYSKRKWQPENLFQSVIEKALPFMTGKFISVAVDDTRVPKTGKKIKSASWHRDPMGPPFQTNLIWAQRFLQFTILLPLYDVFSPSDVPPRSLPIRFIDAPSIKKPGKKATQEQIDIYNQESKKHNLSTRFLQELPKIRSSLDLTGAKDKKVLVVADGSFCNRTCMNLIDDRIEIVARCRKDAKLCFAAPEDSRCFFDKNKFTPEQIRRDETIPWKTEKIFHGGKWRQIDYKEIKNVLWQGGTKRKFIRLIVLRPIKYHVTKTGKAYYRDPAYLLTTEMEATTKEIVQPYFDRWQIEVNHREEKTILGVGQAQVRNAQSVHKQPAFLVAAYSALLLSSVISYGDKINKQLEESIPKWYRTAKRPSFRQLVAQLRKELIEYQGQDLEVAKILEIRSFAQKLAA